MNETHRPKFRHFPNKQWRADQTGTEIQRQYSHLTPTDSPPGLSYGHDQPSLLSRMAHPPPSPLEKKPNDSPSKRLIDRISGWESEGKAIDTHGPLDLSGGFMDSNLVEPVEKEVDQVRVATDSSRSKTLITTPPQTLSSGLFTVNPTTNTMAIQHEVPSSICHQIGAWSPACSTQKFTEHRSQEGHPKKVESNLLPLSTEVKDMVLPLIEKTAERRRDTGAAPLDLVKIRELANALLTNKVCESFYSNMQAVRYQMQTLQTQRSTKSPSPMDVGTPSETSDLTRFENGTRLTALPLPISIPIPAAFSNPSLQQNISDPPRNPRSMRDWDEKPRSKSKGKTLEIVTKAREHGRNRKRDATDRSPSFSRDDPASSSATLNHSRDGSLQSTASGVDAKVRRRRSSSTHTRKSDTLPSNLPDRPDFSTDYTSQSHSFRHSSPPGSPAHRMRSPYRARPPRGDSPSRRSPSPFYLSRVHYRHETRSFRSPSSPSYSREHYLSRRPRSPVSPLSPSRVQNPRRPYSSRGSQSPTNSHSTHQKASNMQTSPHPFDSRAARRSYSPDDNSKSREWSRQHQSSHDPRPLYIPRNRNLHWHRQGSPDSEYRISGERHSTRSEVNKQGPGLSFPPSVDVGMGDSEKTGQQRGDVISAAPLSPKPCYNIPGLWFARTGLDTPGVLECQFEIDRQTALNWSIPQENRDEPREGLELLSLRLLCLPLNKAEAAMASVSPDASAQVVTSAITGIETEWPPIGSLLVDINPKTSFSNTWFPATLSAASPLVELKDYVHEGNNVARMIQLAPMDKYIFVLYASQVPSKHSANDIIDELCEGEKRVEELGCMTITIERL